MRARDIRGDGDRDGEGEGEEVRQGMQEGRRGELILLATRGANDNRT